RAPEPGAGRLCGVLPGAADAPPHTREPRAGGRAARARAAAHRASRGAEPAHGERAARALAPPAPERLARHRPPPALALGRKERCVPRKNRLRQQLTRDLLQSTPAEP